MEGTLRRNALQIDRTEDGESGAAHGWWLLPINSTDTPT